MSRVIGEVRVDGVVSWDGISKIFICELGKGG